MSGRQSQRGMALLVSLVFLLLLTLIGISSMQSATLQEKMAGSLVSRNQSFQAAEQALRIGEGAVAQDSYKLPVCRAAQCGPPAESASIGSAGHSSGSGVTWIATGNGFYAVQNIGTVVGAVNVPDNRAATLYRVTAVGLSGRSRSVLESVYARY